MDPLTLLAALACAGVGAATLKGKQKLEAHLRVRKIIKQAETVAGLPQVTIAEVLKYRLPGHRPCSGKGVIGKDDKARPCECAQKRFIARHKNEVTSIGGGVMVWLRRQETSDAREG